jgi:hypothetical protein
MTKTSNNLDFIQEPIKSSKAGELHDKLYALGRKPR